MATPSEIRVRDPLSEVTRKERRILLGVSALGIIVAKTGLIPSKITSLGIEFSSTDQRSLVWVLGAITVYFLSAFVIYAISDFVAWRIAFYAAALELYRTRRSESGAWNPEPSNFERGAQRWRNISLPTVTLRAVFEFFVPIAVAIYAIYLLLTVT